jgi:hypothetical protein
MILMMTMMGIYDNSYDEDDDNCAEAILNGASIDRSHSEWSHRMMLPTVDGMKASTLSSDNEGIP